jgi:lipid II:glycine glycyltransferase (peptidoglycan interpeptide bridge formation enzyme)
MSKLTIYPPLTWYLFFSALFGKIKKDDPQINGIWCGTKDQAFWFSQSAWSLKAIAQWWAKAFKQKAPNFWIPDYICNQSLKLLRQTGTTLTFYPVTDKLTPDWRQCQQMATESSPDIFMLVHYFGKVSDGQEAKKFCNKFKSILVEDAVHALIPSDGIGSFGDFVCYSPHKLFALPDGAILVQRNLNKVLKKMLQGNSVEIMKEVCGELSQKAPPSWKWVCKRLIQRLIPYVFLRRRLKSYKFDFLKDPSAAPVSDSPFQSKFSSRLLKKQLKHVTQYAAQRKTNLAIINAIADHSNDKMPLFHNHDFIPYLAAIKLDSKKNACASFQKITSDGNPIQSWPDLPPEIIGNPDKYARAVQLRNTLLTFPVHQGFGYKEANYLLQCYLKSIKTQIDKILYRLKTFNGEAKEWSHLLNSAGKSNLLQSWAYGEAKKNIENWDLRRFLITQEEKNIAMVQVLTKRFGPIKIVRINRGPVFLTDLNFSTIKGVYQCLKKRFSVLKGKVLLIAPELNEHPMNDTAIKLSAYNLRRKSTWCSAWLDLSLSEKILRKNLTSKWRNMLNVAERDQLLFFELDVSEQGFQWMMRCYAEMQKQKDFQGPAISLLVELRQQLEQKKDFLICRALNSEKEVVAAAVLSFHGSSATYLIGWNGNEGRKLKANNFLLWNGILELKRRGCQWFDIGGIDEINTPDISRFKKGMNGELYSLIGEWCNFKILPFSP